VNVGLALKQLHDAELELAKDYRKIGERHAVEHDVYHHTREFARVCETHATALAAHAERYGKTLDPGNADALDSMLNAFRRMNAALLGRAEATGLLLLRDLKNLWLQAQEVEILWVIAGQCAKAARDEPLLEVVTACHRDTMRQWKWLKTRIKDSADQILVAG
jgi:hypothetical protein